MSRTIRNLTIIVEVIGKRIPVEEIEEDVTFGDLVSAVFQKCVGVVTFESQIIRFAKEIFADLYWLLLESASLSELLHNNLRLSVSADRGRLDCRENITPLDFLKMLATDNEILTHLAKGRDWPDPRRVKPYRLRGIVIRKLSRKQLPLHETLRGAGIKDRETLIVDFDRTAGFHIDFYSNGNLREIEFTPEEVPYIVEILDALQRIRKELVTDAPTSVSASIQNVYDSTIVVSGRDSAQTSSRNSEPKQSRASQQRKTPPGSNISVKAQNFAVSGTNVTFGGGTITNVTLGGSDPPSGDRPAFDRSVIDDDREASLCRQLAQHRENLNHLEEQLAKYGQMDAPLRLLNQIDDERTEIRQLEALLSKD